MFGFISDELFTKYFFLEQLLNRDFIFRPGSTKQVLLVFHCKYHITIMKLICLKLAALFILAWNCPFFYWIFRVINCAATKYMKYLVNNLNKTFLSILFRIIYMNSGTWTCAMFLLQYILFLFVDFQDFENALLTLTHNCGVVIEDNQVQIKKSQNKFTTFFSQMFEPFLLGYWVSLHFGLIFEFEVLSLSVNGMLHSLTFEHGVIMVSMKNGNLMMIIWFLNN